jgi:prophage regulatory protein
MKKIKKNFIKTKNRFIRLNEVMSRTGYGRTSIYRKMEDGDFPKNVKLGGPLEDPDAFDSRAVAWIEDEVEQWIDSRIEGRDLVSTDLPAGQNIER